MSVIKKETIDVRKVGTALIGGDFTGNARGTFALDIQTSRAGVTHVASGTYATALGFRNIASGTKSLAIGSNNTASGNYSTASGYYNRATGIDSIALGYANQTTGDYSTASGNYNTASGNYTTAIGNFTQAIGNNSTAIGNLAIANIAKTTNICGPQINRKDDGETAGTAFESFCGVEVILMSKEVDMKVVADYTITLPANCKFWLNEIGIITCTVTDLVAQPTVRYGITGDLDKHNAAAITTALTAADKREIETPLVPEDGEVSLTGGITIAANTTIFTGRFYWKGMLVEDAFVF